MALPCLRKRVETCKARKAGGSTWLLHLVEAHCELQEAFIDYIEYKDDQVVTPMARSVKEFFIRACGSEKNIGPKSVEAWRDVACKSPTAILAPSGNCAAAALVVVREMLRMQEVEENYILSMKLPLYSKWLYILGVKSRGST